MKRICPCLALTFKERIIKLFARLNKQLRKVRRPQCPANCGLEGPIGSRLYNIDPSFGNSEQQQISVRSNKYPGKGAVKARSHKKTLNRVV